MPSAIRYAFPLTIALGLGALAGCGREPVEVAPAAVPAAPVARVTPRAPTFVFVSEVGVGPAVSLRLSAPAAHALFVDNCNGAFSWGLERQQDGRWEAAWGAETDACLSAPIVVAPGTSREFALVLHGAAGHALREGTYRAVVYGMYADYPPTDHGANAVLAVERRTSAPFRFVPADAP